MFAERNHDFLVQLARMDWLAIAVAVFVNFVIGGLWYSPALFMNRWMAITGVDREQFNANLPRALLGDLYASVAMAYALMQFDAPLPAALVAWACFVAPVLLTSATYEQRPFRFFLINAGYRLVSLTAMGAVLNFMR